MANDPENYKPVRLGGFVGGRVKKSFRGESDINAIMRKYVSTGVSPMFNAREPRYGDFSSGVDYLTAANLVRLVESRFQELPAAIRSHCKNDPADLLDLVNNPGRKDECVKLGLLPAAEPAPVAAGESAAKAAGTEVAGEKK